MGSVLYFSLEQRRAAPLPASFPADLDLPGFKVSIRPESSNLLFDFRSTVTQEIIRRTAPVAVLRDLIDVVDSSFAKIASLNPGPEGLNSKDQTTMAEASNMAYGSLEAFGGYFSPNFLSSDAMEHLYKWLSDRLGTPRGPEFG